jgi:hypothetical protein
LKWKPRAAGCGETLGGGGRRRKKFRAKKQSNLLRVLDSRLQSVVWETFREKTLSFDKHFTNSFPVGSVAGSRKPMHRI